MKAEHDSAKGGLDLTGPVAAGEQAAATSVVFMVRASGSVNERCALGETTDVAAACSPAATGPVRSKPP